MEKRISLLENEVIRRELENQNCICPPRPKPDLFNIINILPLNVFIILCGKYMQISIIQPLRSFHSLRETGQ